MNRSNEIAAVPAVGLDVGFFSTKFSAGRSGLVGSAIKVLQFPSLAPRISGAMQHLAAKDDLDGVVLEVEPGVRHFVGKDVFHIANAPGSRAVTSDYSRTSDYRALTLGALFHLAKEKCVAGDRMVISQLVAGLPLSTVYSHASELEASLARVHCIPHPGDRTSTLQVEIQAVKVIAQPQGALLAQGIGAGAHSRAEFNTLVLDLGGGTFDWFMARGAKPNRARCGAIQIGALTCAAAVCDEIAPDLRDDAEVMARVDRALSDRSKTVTISGISYNMGAFDGVVRRVLRDAIEQMQKSVGSLNSVDQILLTGGGARLMHESLSDSLPKYRHLLKMDLEPVSSNTRGFHLLAEHLANRRTLSN